MRKNFVILAFAAIMLVSCQNEMTIVTKNSPQKAKSERFAYTRNSLEGVIGYMDEVFYDAHQMNTSDNFILYGYPFPYKSDTTGLQWVKCLPPYSDWCTQSFKHAEGDPYIAGDLVDYYGYDTTATQTDFMVICKEDGPEFHQGKLSNIVYGSDGLLESIKLTKLDGTQIVSYKEQ